MEVVNQNKDRKKRKPSVDLSTMVYGKIPPQARDLEEAVLGTIMSVKSGFDAVIEIIQAESFYVDAHIKIFKAFQRLSNRNQPIDISTVVNELKTMEELESTGGPYYITKLTNSTSANIVTYARIIQQKFIQREVIRISGEAISEAYEDSTDVFELLQSFEKNLSSVALSSSKKSYKKLDAVNESLLNKLEGLRKRKVEITGVPTGISRLDSVTCGWQNGFLIVLAARPSIGKSAIAANFARAAAMHDEKATPVGIFSMEMGDEQWAKRILSAESEVDHWQINKAKLDDKDMQKLYTAGESLMQANIFIDDTAGMNIYEFKSKARKMVLQDKVGLIIVDYLQLMSGTGERGQNREQEISNISRNLKALGKELQVPIIALSQLSRAVEQRGSSRRPVLSDLRESGAIEQDADIVAFLIPIEDDEVAKDASLKDSMLIKVSKHRDGPLDEVEVKFVKEIQKIMSRSDYESYKVRSQMKGQGFVPVEVELF